MTFALFNWFGENNNLRYILEGFLANLEVAVIAMFFAFIVALFLALMRLARNRVLSFATGIWVDVFRNLPLVLLVIFLGNYLVPESWRDFWEDNVPGWAPEAFESGLLVGAFLALILYNSAVLAEIMRAGILSLPRGQGEAASALGMTYWQSLRHVILPQGLRRMVPALVGQLITLNKDTTLISLIAIQEVVRRGRIVNGTAGNPFTGSKEPAPFLEIFIVIGILFVAVNYALSRLSRRLELRERSRTGTKLERVKGLEDQVAADPV
jgi:His/Glu/Gln/Arg/opine family amino acid ABC transporter permease subunit